MFCFVLFLKKNEGLWHAPQLPVMWKSSMAFLGVLGWDASFTAWTPMTFAFTSPGWWGMRGIKDDVILKNKCMGVIVLYVNCKCWDKSASWQLPSRQQNKCVYCGRAWPALGYLATIAGKICWILFCALGTGTIQCTLYNMLPFALIAPVNFHWDKIPLCKTREPKYWPRTIKCSLWSAECKGISLKTLASVKDEEGIW